MQRPKNRAWEREHLYTFSELSQLNDAPVKKSRWTLRQWARSGVVLNGTKERIKLPSIVIGCMRYTSVEALREFIKLFKDHQP